jgi:hypothetical protein
MSAHVRASHPRPDAKVVTHRVRHDEPDHRADERVGQRKKKQIPVPLIRGRRDRAANERDAHQQRIRHVRRGEQRAGHRRDEILMSRTE